MHLLILVLFMILFFVTFSRKQSLDWPNEEGYLLAIVDPISGQNVGLKVGDHGLEKIKRAFEIAREIQTTGGQLERLFQPFKFERNVD